MSRPEVALAAAAPIQPHQEFLQRLKSIAKKVNQKKGRKDFALEAVVEAISNPKDLDMGGLLTCPSSFEFFADDDNNRAMITPCGHTFSKDAIDTWAADHQSCIICKTKIAVADLKPNALMTELSVQYMALSPIEKLKLYIALTASEDVCRQIFELLDLSFTDGDDDADVNLNKKFSVRLDRTTVVQTTLLHQAVMHFQTDVVAWLCQQSNLDCSVTDSNGKAALDYASELGNIKAVELIQNKNTASTAFGAAPAAPAPDQKLAVDDELEKIFKSLLSGPKGKDWVVHDLNHLRTLTPEQVSQIDRIDCADRGAGDVKLVLRYLHAMLSNDEAAVTEAFNNLTQVVRRIGCFNLIFDAVYNSNLARQERRQYLGAIRSSAFDHEQNLQPTADDWVALRGLTVFCKHRDWYAMGRTSTLIEIDKKIKASRR
ncbi:MAG: ankyrin repeat domain-containing protein [Gammaproteobacteria bacterium]|nr:ankyrin repeat domain-containing protein [Gammaproteobacteria bacterium]MCH9744363.1 ankyrin repeat domain-containing protein [Gammaproteobacteria bacterium]